MKIINVYSFTLEDEKIFIEELWCLLQLIISYIKNERILHELLSLLLKIISYDNQIEYIVRGTPTIHCLCFCLQNLQNNENNPNIYKKDCCCLIIKIIMTVMEKTENPDFFLINLKVNKEIQQFFRKFAFKNFTKISNFLYI